MYNQKIQSKKIIQNTLKTKHQNNKKNKEISLNFAFFSYL